MIINRFFGKKGFKINGTVYSATVASGNTVQAGDFVLVSGETNKTASRYISGYNNIPLGVAKTGGTSGETISVYLPI